MEFKNRREPDYTQFLKVLRREGRPDHLPFYEHLASTGFMAARTGQPLDQWSPDHPDFWRVYVDFWLGLGFDVVPMEIAPPWHLEQHEDTAGKVSHGSEATVTIRNMDDFNRYPWPDEECPLDFGHFERAAECLPEGARIVAGVCGGPYEWSTSILGVQGLALAVYMDPELVEAFYGKLMGIYTSANRRLAQYAFVCALRQGDDLGYKTSTFLSPDHLRQYVFPIYKQMAAIAHEAGKPFILHSCGNLNEVYEDLIVDCRIDAKHSFEDVILPVVDFKRAYGDRITPLGGLDVDRICRADEADLRRYVREVAEVCYADGYWAMGTGNSLTNYMPVENYLIVADEAMRIA